MDELSRALIADAKERYKQADRLYVLACTPDRYGLDLWSMRYQAALARLNSAWREYADTLRDFGDE
jgi:hypothetical protein